MKEREVDEALCLLLLLLLTRGIRVPSFLPSFSSPLRLLLFFFQDDVAKRKKKNPICLL